MSKSTQKVSKALAEPTPIVEVDIQTPLAEDVAVEPAPKKQRTAYVMTEKRKEAFAKCQQARLKNIQARKEQAAAKA